MMIFPDGGLDQSILVTVLVGVFVLLALTEFFGWVWAGLVVPGYLASVFAIQPPAGVAICFEAVVTFIVSRAASDTMSRLGGWSPFFGRERFFLIVLVSVIVRQASELWIIDSVLRILDQRMNGSLGASHDVASIGLVLVPLLANMAWKLSLRRAAFQIGVSVGVTWVIVANVLLPFTNLSYSSLELTYENVALDFLASPKAYIILLTTAFLAARFNLTYGWDYNGILVPSLIALTWFQPWLFVATVAEALVLYFASRAALAFPLLKRRNLEGPRKLALVLSVGFALKLALGWVLVVWWPEIRVTNLFGFGYVLTSLIAVKMINLKKTGRVLLPSIAVSLFGYVTASAIGFGLEQVAPRPHAPVLRETDSASSRRLWRAPLGVMALASVRAQGSRGLRDADVDRRLLSSYASLWRGLVAWMQTRSSSHPPPGNHLVARADELGLRLVSVPESARPAWALVDAQEQLAAQLGWDTALLFPGAPGPVLIVPSAANQEPVGEAAAVLCESLQCRAILVSGSDGGPRSPFHVARRALESQELVELRGDATVSSGHPRLHIRDALPSSVRLPMLWPGRAQLTWDPPPGQGGHWADAAPEVVLRVHPDDLWQRLATSSPEVRMQARTSVVTWLDAWYVRSDSEPGPPSPPSQTELLVLERLVFERLVANQRDPGIPRGRLRWVAQVARSLDHEIVGLPDGASRSGGSPEGTSFGAWAIAGIRGRGWLAAVIAERPAELLAIEVPWPRVETGVGRVAAHVWGAAGASALVFDAEWSADSKGKVAGVGYIDVVGNGNVATAFQAVHQALARSMGSEAAIVQLRGFAATRSLRDDLIISLGTPLLDPARAPAGIARILDKAGPIGRLGGSQRWVDGAAEVVELAGAGNPQLLFSRATGGPGVAIVWLSEPIRMGARRVGDRADTLQRAERLGLRFIDQPVAAALHDGIVQSTPVQATPDRLRLALKSAADYAATLDLAALAQAAAVRGVTASLGWDQDARAGYVLLEIRDRASVVRAAAVAGCAAFGNAADVGAASLVPRRSDFDGFRSPRRAEREACGVSATGGNATERNDAIGDGSAARIDQNLCGEVLVDTRCQSVMVIRGTKR